MNKLTNDSANNYYQMLLGLHQGVGTSGMKITNFWDMVVNHILPEVSGLSKGALDDQKNWIKTNTQYFDRNTKKNIAGMSRTLNRGLFLLFDLRNEIVHEGLIPDNADYQKMVQVLANLIHYFSGIPIPGELRNIIEGNTTQSAPEKHPTPNEKQPEQTIKPISLTGKFSSLIPNTVFCPVCKTDYPRNVTKCNKCGYSDNNGFFYLFYCQEDWERWLKEVIMPLRNKWQENN